VLGDGSRRAHVDTPTVDVITKMIEALQAKIDTRRRIDALGVRCCDECGADRVAMATGARALTASGGRRRSSGGGGFRCRSPSTVTSTPSALWWRSAVA
jgi:hypothetical protein